MELISVSHKRKEIFPTNPILTDQLIYEAEKGSTFNS